MENPPFLWKAEPGLTGKSVCPEIYFVPPHNKEDFHTAVSKAVFALCSQTSTPVEGCWFVTFRMLKTNDSRIQSSLLPVAFESNSVQNSCRKGAAEGIYAERETMGKATERMPL